MAYIVCFVLALTFFHFSEKLNGLKKLLCIIVGILIPSILAGIRAYEIGTDIFFYVRQVFDSATEATSLSWMKWWNSRYGVEYGYLFLNHIISRFTDKYAWVFFYVELIILILIYKSFAYFNKYVSKNIKIAQMFMLYFFLMYNESLNLMRQSISIAIILYGFRYVYEKKLLKYLITVVVAMQFHITSLLAIVIYPLYILIHEKKQYKLKYVLLGISLVSGAVFGKGMELITNTGIFGDKFLKYFQDGSDYTFSYSQLVIRIPFIFLFWYMAKRQNKRKEYNNFIVVMLLLDLAFAELRGIHATLYRLSLYFSVFKCVVYPEVISTFSYKYRKITKTLLLLFAFVLWYYQVVLMNNGHTYPYMLNPYLGFNICS